MRIVAIVSGGLDSTTLAYHLADQGHELTLLSFDYGQSHRVELDYAQQAADRIGADWHLVDLRSITGLLSASSLTGGKAIPDGHYAEETMRATVVPNRNMIMLAVAAGHAVSIEAQTVATGVHAGDHFIYPDCRPRFVDAMRDALLAANDGFTVDGFDLVAPFLQWTKADIARRAGELGVPIERTWSCYKGGERHCGRCGTCVERQWALNEAGVADPTEYADVDFWRQAEAEHAAGVRR